MVIVGATKPVGKVAGVCPLRACGLPRDKVATLCVIEMCRRHFLEVVTLKPTFEVEEYKKVIACVEGGGWEMTGCSENQDQLKGCRGGGEGKSGAGGAVIAKRARPRKVCLMKVIRWI